MRFFWQKYHIIGIFEECSFGVNAFVVILESSFYDKFSVKNSSLICLIWSLWYLSIKLRLMPFYWYSGFSLSHDYLVDFLLVFNSQHLNVADWPDGRASSCLWDWFLLCSFSWLSISCWIHVSEIGTHTKLSFHLSRKSAGLISYSWVLELFPCSFAVRCTFK